jgi:mRNA-degrading endonuclease RelE of RelBE toxin-antitoxin system
MSYEVYLADTFQKCVKRLKKKFPHIKEDLSPIIKSLQNDPDSGDPIPGWEKKIWKIRVGSTDLKRGKSGGFRVIYLWGPGQPNVFLLFTYFKGEKEDVTHKEIEALLNKLDKELTQN